MDEIDTPAPTIEAALRAERDRRRWLVEVGVTLTGPAGVDRMCAAAVEFVVPALATATVLLIAERTARVRWWGSASGTCVRDGWVAAVDLPAEAADALTGHADLRPLLWPAGLLIETTTGAADATTGAADATIGAADATIGAADATIGAANATTGAAHVISLPVLDGPAAALVLFGSLDAERVRIAAARIGAALDTARLRQWRLDVADSLQQSLSPGPLQETPGTHWGTAYRPARSVPSVGGDFYGTQPLAGGQVLFFLGDVSGKGIEAALHADRIRQAVRVLSRSERDPRRLLRQLNAVLLEEPEAGFGGLFATVVLGAASPGPRGLTLTCAGGGHLPALVLRADGSVEPVAVGGMPIGVVDEPVLGGATVWLAPGESCVMVTDGVTEAHGGHHDERLGMDRLINTLAGGAVMPAPAIAERIAHLTTDWLHSPDHDDIAVLVVRADDPKRHGRPGRRGWYGPLMRRRAVNAVKAAPP
jgi:serine phosphatase RsbU (regulator of sigma subunit)